MLLCVQPHPSPAGHVMLCTASSLVLLAPSQAGITQLFANQWQAPPVPTAGLHTDTALRRSARGKIKLSWKRGKWKLKDKNLKCAKTQQRSKSHTTQLPTMICAQILYLWTKSCLIYNNSNLILFPPISNSCSSTTLPLSHLRLELSSRKKSTFTELPPEYHLLPQLECVPEEFVYKNVTPVWNVKRVKM